ncbi:hypothetical protein BRADI_2g37525v3, partial [Brachypodium distachyon]
VGENSRREGGLAFFPRDWAALRPATTPRRPPTQRRPSNPRATRAAQRALREAKLDPDGRAVLPTTPRRPTNTQATPTSPRQVLVTPTIPTATAGPATVSPNLAAPHQVH